MRIAFAMFFVSLAVIGTLSVVNGSRVARFFLTASVADAFIKKHGEQKLKYSMQAIGLLFIVLGAHFLSRQ
jgi:uncharacterized membrane protein